MMEKPGSKWLRIGSVRVFDDVEDSKQQALKPLEEASEVLEAWKRWERTKGAGDDWDAHVEHNEALIDLVDECCDVIQATCNLLAALGIPSLRDDMDRCERRNRERGRITR